MKIDKDYFEVFDNLVPNELQEELEHNFAWMDIVPWAFNHSSNFRYENKSKTKKFLHPDMELIDGVVNRSRLNIIDRPQFTHTFINDEGMSTRIVPSIQFIINLMTCFPFSVKEVTRAKMNMTTPVFGDDDSMGYPHVDNRRQNSLTAIYYVNDSDGDTILFNENIQDLTQSSKLTIRERITPKKGRFIVFNTSIMHSPQPPKTTDSRVVINFNFTPLARK